MNFCLKVMQKCNQMIMACEWQGTMEKCSDLFSITRTDAGFCCSFNVVRPGLQLYVLIFFINMAESPNLKYSN